MRKVHIGDLVRHASGERFARLGYGIVIGVIIYAMRFYRIEWCTPDVHATDNNLYKRETIKLISKVVA